ncbi:hypothetical protein EDD16DRAFT_279218 [Pisolithus croceorrhizus]|nr:hypothetical protein EDD16DRAFT_279218 [Pisolithus croceorrhizus]KAI6117489.1 hypothetical protein EV401DRAFT_1969000 [Pisolithus croceorrhizus]KAI6118157.1 hypothetical protein F5141DRAFT_604362 [Pisolithus sp. B1]
MVAVKENYLASGCGKHACPGRFLAADELKTMLAYVLISYDVKFEGRNTRPNKARRRFYARFHCQAYAPDHD